MEHVQQPCPRVPAGALLSTQPGAVGGQPFMMTTAALGRLERCWSISGDRGFFLDRAGTEVHFDRQQGVARRLL
jgi:hypothetical protein